MGQRGSRLRRWRISFAAWTAAGTFSVLHACWSAILDGRQPIPRLIALSMINVWLWAAWTDSLLWWAHRLPMDRRRWHIHLLGHALLSIGYAAASTGFNVVLAALVFQPFRRSFEELFIHELFFNVVSYGAVIVIAHAIAYADQLADRRLRAVELEHELTRAQLHALEMQLRPHFLFNALHSVAGLVRSGRPDAAVQMIGGLGDLLRIVLDDDRAQELTLADELTLAERYLAIEQIRFADRLQIAFEIAPSTRDVLVPRLVLQPLLENAIRHGVQTREAGGMVIIRAACRDDVVILDVIDQQATLASSLGQIAGAPGTAARTTGHGLGLANTRARLRHLYGDHQRVDLERSDAGTTVRISLPLRRAGAV